MNASTAEQLSAGRCAPCTGKTERYNREQAEAQVAVLEGWQLSPDARRIRKDWRMKDFAAAMAFFAEVAVLAEQEGHHPDLHLEAYRHAWIELWTHAIGGLSANDFILAAKIDRLAERE